MKEVYRVIVFSKVPLKGYFRFKNKFQIFPLELPNMPISGFQKHFPLVLQVRITESEIITFKKDSEVLKGFYEEYGSVSNFINLIIKLLNTFGNNYFFLPNLDEGFWGVPMYVENPKEEDFKSVWCFPFYNFPGLSNSFQENEFHIPTVNQIKFLPHKEFYMRYPNLDFRANEEICFPNSMEGIIDSFFSLDSNKREILEVAINYTASAIELKKAMKTLSLLASFTSVETMVNLEFSNIKPEFCKVCGQPKYSIAKKFREYLLKYVGNSDSNKRRFNKYYNLRSKIVHQGIQLKIEQIFKEVEPKEMEEEILHTYEILQIGKLAIVNWLLLNCKKVK